MPCVLDLRREKLSAETRWRECCMAHFAMGRVNHEHHFRPSAWPDSFFGGNDLRRMSRKRYYWGSKAAREGAFG